MKMKKIPMRECIVTKERLPKKELVRIVRTPEGEVVVDTTGKANGRGAYLKIDKEVFLKAKSSKILNKTLNIEVPNEVFDKLNELIK